MIIKHLLQEKKDIREELKDLKDYIRNNESYLEIEQPDLKSNIILFINGLQNRLKDIEAELNKLKNKFQKTCLDIYIS